MAMAVHAAEAAYMNAGGADARASFADMAASFDPDVVLHRSCRLVTRSRASGKTLDLPMAQIVRVPGDRIVEFRPFCGNVPVYRETVGSAR